MTLFYILTACFTLSFVHHSYGQIEHRGASFQRVGDLSMKNLKLNPFSDSLGSKDEEGNENALQTIAGNQNGGVRRKFNTMQFWKTRSSTTNPGSGNKHTGETSQGNQFPNGFANPFLSRTRATPSTVTQGRPTLNVRIPPQTGGVHPPPFITNPPPFVTTTWHSGGIPSLEKLDEKFEFGGENLHVPCQWSGCIGDFQCKKIVNNNAVVCDANDMGLCQCMREKVITTTTVMSVSRAPDAFVPVLPPDVVSGTLPVPDDMEVGGESMPGLPCQMGGCAEPYQCMTIKLGQPINCEKNIAENCQCMKQRATTTTTTTTTIMPKSRAPDAFVPVLPPDVVSGTLPIPDDMEVGGESMPGLPCQMGGCAEPYQCMTIKLGRPIICDKNIAENCKCMKKRDQPPSTEVPLVLTTDSIIPCQFWGCESGYQCLLIANGQKQSCPTNSNAPCQCMRHVLG